MKSLSLKAWIKKIGRIEVARLLGVTPMTVTHWRQGTAWPKVKQMQKIKKLTKGVVDYDGIIDGGRR